MSTATEPKTPQADTTPIDWMNIITQWKSSGMSQAAYCEANNINYNQFVYQSAKISARAKVSAKLLPVKVTQSEYQTTAHNNFMLHYPTGLKVYIPINTHPEAIRALLSCVEK